MLTGRSTETLASSYSENVYEPAFVLGVNHKLRWLILAIRGSCGMRDVMTDINAEEGDFCVWYPVEGGEWDADPLSEAEAARVEAERGQGRRRSSGREEGREARRTITSENSFSGADGLTGAQTATAAGERQGARSPPHDSGHNTGLTAPHDVEDETPLFIDQQIPPTSRASRPSSHSEQGIASPPLALQAGTSPRPKPGEVSPPRRLPAAPHQHVRRRTLFTTHKGFVRAADFVYSRIKALVEKFFRKGFHKGVSTRRYCFVFTGHSLGAATASLLFYKYPQIGNKKLFLFGCPGVIAGVQRPGRAGGRNENDVGGREKQWGERGSPGGEERRRRGNEEGKNEGSQSEGEAGEARVESGRGNRDESGRGNSVSCGPPRAPGPPASLVVADRPDHRRPPPLDITTLDEENIRSTSRTPPPDEENSTTTIGDDAVQRKNTARGGREPDPKTTVALSSHEAVASTRSSGLSEGLSARDAGAGRSRPTPRAFQQSPDLGPFVLPHLNFPVDRDPRIFACARGKDFASQLSFQVGGTGPTGFP